MRLICIIKNSEVCLSCLLILISFSGCQREKSSTPSLPPKPVGPFHVYPKGDIQAALDLAARAENKKEVIVHEGSYHPATTGFSFLSLTAKHDGVVLRADGNVTLSAKPVTSTRQPLSSAIVSHVIFCGEGVTEKTIIEGFRVSDADGYVSQENDPNEIRLGQGPAPTRGMFYYMDGGALKIYGNSHPTIKNVRFINNSTKLCGGAVSIEQQGFCKKSVHFENCVFKENRCPGTGAAVDVLEGSSAVIQNCLFVNNIANYGMDEIDALYGLVYNAKHGCGALTVFPNSKVEVIRSTFTANWNGVDDHGAGSTYVRCILWKNDQTDGSRPGDPYEFDIINGEGVRDCFIGGEIEDLRMSIDPKINKLQAPSPDFDENFIPQNQLYGEVGYRPILLRELSDDEANSTQPPLQQ